jgi:hypothetical protein
LIVYYAGYGFVGSDHNLYWAWYDEPCSASSPMLM